MLTNGRRSNAYDADTFANNLAFDQRVYGVLYDIEQSIAGYDAVCDEDVKAIIRESLSKPKAFLGIGQNDSFLPKQEFDAIMTLQEPAQGRSLKKEFKPQGI